MLRLSLTLCLTAAVLCLNSASAFAAIDNVGAMKLKELFTKLVEQQKSSHTISGGELITTGNVVVEPAGTYYAVTLPSITTIDKNGNRAELGMIAINTIPGDEEGQWKMSIAWPSPITYIDTNGKPSMKIEMGGQRMAGLYDEGLENFIKLDAAYKNIRLDNYEEDVRVTIPEVDIKYNLDEIRPGMYSGPVTARLNNLSVRDGAQTETLKVDSATINIQMKELSSAKNKAVHKELNSLAARIQSKDSDTITSEDKEAVFNAMAKTFESLGEGFTSQYEIKGLKIYKPENRGTDKPDTIQMSRFGFGLDMEGFAQNNVKLGLRIAYEGMQVAPQPADFAEVSPRSFALDLSLNDVPFNELKSMANNALITTAQNPAAAQMNKVQAVMAIPQLLTSSGTNLTLNRAMLVSDLMDIKMSGKAIADSNAALGATGFMNAQIFGLKELMAYAQEVAEKSKQTGEKPALARLFPLIVLLRGTAEEGKDDQGRPVSKFHLTLDSTGQVMINDTSIDALKPAQ